jgi:FkbM family methyltransferase
MIDRTLNFVRNSLQDVRSCPDFAGKVAIATSSAGRLLTVAINGVAHRIAGIGHDLVPDYVGLFRDIRIVNGDGVFYCRKQTSDYAIARYDYERALRQYFTLESGVFVDVGAHIGKYAVMVARHLEHRGQVVAIEPDAGNFYILSKNLELNRLLNARAINVACWDCEAELPLYLDTRDPIKHSLTVQSAQSVSVKARPLDAVLQEHQIAAVDLLKIDAEGADFRVLRGAIETLKRSPKLRVILEGGEPKALDLLKSLGFRLIRTKHHFGRNGCYYLAEKVHRPS